MENLTHYQPNELYDRIEDLITTRSIYGRGRTEEASHCRNVINPELRRLRRELNRRGLPSRRWQYDAERETETWADEKAQERELSRGA